LKYESYVKKVTIKHFSHVYGLKAFQSTSAENSTSLVLSFSHHDENNNRNIIRN